MLWLTRWNCCSANATGHRPAQARVNSFGSFGLEKLRPIRSASNWRTHVRDHRNRQATVEAADSAQR